MENHSKPRLCVKTTDNCKNNYCKTIRNNQKHQQRQHQKQKKSLDIRNGICSIEERVLKCQNFAVIGCVVNRS